MYRWGHGWISDEYGLGLPEGYHWKRPYCLDLIVESAADDRAPFLSSHDFVLALGCTGQHSDLI